MKKMMFMALVMVGFSQISLADDDGGYQQPKTLTQKEQQLLDDAVSLKDIANAIICAEDLATCEMQANSDDYDNRSFDNSLYKHSVLTDDIQILRQALHVSYLNPTEMEQVKIDLKIMEDRHKADLDQEQKSKDDQARQDNCRVWDVSDFCWRTW